MDNADIRDIADGLRRGETIVYPTETCYGLGCDATSASAVERVCRLKGRPKEKSLILIADSLARMEPYVEITPAILTLAKKYWPGALTVVVPLKQGATLPNSVVRDDGTIAFRVSGNAFARRLVGALGRPIVSTSANISGGPNPYTIQEAIVEADMAIDAGALPETPPSTVVRIEGNAYRVIRQGAVSVSGQMFSSRYAIFAGCVAAILIIYAWQRCLQSISASVPIDLAFPVRESWEVRLANLQARPRQRTIKGLYLTAYSAGNPKKVDEIVALLDRTELNAVVIDIKDYTGKVLFDSHMAIVDDLDLEHNQLGDVRALVKKFHDHGAYVIARQTLFQDPALAEKKPAWALKMAGGPPNGEARLWRDYKGLAWVDPTNEAVWNYNADIAREAIRFGFDEINFDYVRFPSDGNMSLVAYTNGNEERHAVMRRFYAFLDEELRYEPVRISLDFFGFVMERHDGMSIGQRLEDAVDSVDYISPMMYPSHYPVGHLGFNNPADYPARVIENGLEKGLPYFLDKRAKVRPWLQAFSLGAVYDAEKIRAQIDAVEKYTDAGWLLWNASNRYTDAGLRGE